MVGPSPETKSRPHLEYSAHPPHIALRQANKGLTMWKELATFLILYFVAMAGHSFSHRWHARRAKKVKEAEEADTLNAISPLYVAPDELSRFHPAHPDNKHLTAFLLAFVVHPATAASAKEYVIHFLVYSGYVIGH